MSGSEDIIRTHGYVHFKTIAVKNSSVVCLFWSDEIEVVLKSQLLPPTPPPHGLTPYLSLGCLTFGFVLWVEAVTSITAAYLWVCLGPPPVPGRFGVILQDTCDYKVCCLLQDTCYYSCLLHGTCDYSCLLQDTCDYSCLLQDTCDYNCINCILQDTCDYSHLLQNTCDYSCILQNIL